MAGDNNLSQPPLIATSADLAEMMAVGSDSNLQVIVQLDTAQGGVKRLKVERGGVTVVESLGELNTAEPQTLTDFLTWGVNHFPSQHRALILWSHGNGYQKPGNEARTIHEPSNPRYGILQDDTDGITCCLSNRAVREAISAANIHFDLLGFDASQMATIEAAYEFRAVADLLVFSQETGQENGWDYTAILNGLAQNSGITPEALAGVIVQAYRNFYEQVFYPAHPNFEQYLTISAVRLGADMEALALRVSDLVKQLTAAIQDSSSRDTTTTSIGSAFDSSQGMAVLTAPYVYIDLFDFAQKLSDRFSPGSSIQDAIANLVSLRGRVVVSEYHGNARPGGTGLSIVFFKLPEAATFNVYDPDYISGARNLQFINDTNWNEFLSVYYRAKGLL